MFHLGISGPIASGKSFAGEIIHTELRSRGHNPMIIPFALDVRMVARCEWLETPESTIYDLVRSWGYSGARAGRFAELVAGAFRQYPSTAGRKNRQLLQAIGGAGRAELAPDVWIQRVLARVPQHVDVVISPDLRFNNEADGVGLHVHIDASADPTVYAAQIAQVASGDATYTHADASERSLTRVADVTLPVGFTRDDITRLALPRVPAMVRYTADRVAPAVPR